MLCLTESWAYETTPVFDGSLSSLEHCQRAAKNWSQLLRNGRQTSYQTLSKNNRCFVNSSWSRQNEQKNQIFALLLSHVRRFFSGVFTSSLDNAKRRIIYTKQKIETAPLVTHTTKMNRKIQIPALLLSHFRWLFRGFSLVVWRSQSVASFTLSRKSKRRLWPLTQQVGKNSNFRAIIVAYQTIFFLFYCLCFTV